MNQEKYQSFCRYLETSSGIVLGDSKQYLVRSRLTPLVREHQFDDVDQLIDKIVNRGDRRIAELAVDAMTTNETQWFRDKHPFDILVNKLVPELNAKSGSSKIWSAACSSGQEPYSIAMSLTDAIGGMAASRFQIVATDISPSMLEHCRQAKYESLSLARGLSEEHKRSHFLSNGDGSMTLKPGIKQMVQFKPLNLLESYSTMGKFDIIFCRNVLIYFSADVKKKILQQFAACLNPGGYLFLGASESISGLSEQYNMIRCNPGIVYQKK